MRSPNKTSTISHVLCTITVVILTTFRPSTSLAAYWEEYEDTNPNRITRQQIINKAKEYANYRFHVRESNLTGPNGIFDYQDWKTIMSPITRTGPQIGIPYKWGGNDSISAFQNGLNAGKKAGDKCIPTCQACPCQDDFTVSAQAVGVDSSGFISQVWGLEKKYSTRNLDRVSIPLDSINELQPGDILLKQGNPGRVMLFSHRDSGRFYVYEPSLIDWKVALYSYTLYELEEYKPYRYKGFN
jgi:cell wall-associated NlpC family hydrolase